MTWLPKTATVRSKGFSSYPFADFDFEGFSDPYCKLFLLQEDGRVVVGSKKQTKVLKKTLNPEWNAIFTMSVSHFV